MIRFKKLRTTYWSSLFFASLMLILFYSISYRASYKHEINSGLHEVSSFGQMYGEQVSRSISAVELLLADIQHNFEQDRDWKKWKEVEGYEYLRRRSVVQMPQLRDILLIDEVGKQLFHSTYFPSKALMLSDRPYFQQSKMGEDKVLWGPHVSRNSGKAGYIVARRINGVDNRFSGVVAGVLELEHFQSVCWSGRINQELEAYIIDTTEGTIISECRPGEDLGTERSVVGQKLRDINPVYVSAGLSKKSQVVGDYLVSYKVIPGYSNLALVVVLSKDAALASWKKSNVYNICALVLGLLVLAFSCFIVRRELKKN